MSTPTRNTTRSPRSNAWAQHGSVKPLLFPIGLFILDCNNLYQSPFQYFHLLLETMSLFTLELLFLNNWRHVMVELVYVIPASIGSYG